MIEWQRTDLLLAGEASRSAAMVTSGDTTRGATYSASRVTSVAGLHGTVAVKPYCPSAAERGLRRAEGLLADRGGPDERSFVGDSRCSKYNAHQLEPVQEPEALIWSCEVYCKCNRRVRSAMDAR